MKVELSIAQLGRLMRAYVATALTASLAVALTPTALAAESVEEANQAVEAAETDVSRTAAAYDNAVAEQDRIAEEIATLDSKISKIEEELPAQQERSDESCIELYKLSGFSSSMVATMLSAATLSDAVALVDSYNYIIDQNVNQMVKTANMKSDLESSREKLVSEKESADAAADAAEEALAAAKQARADAKERAAAAQKAEQEEAERAAAEKQASATTKKQKKAAAAEAEKESQSASNASVDNVDWSADKSAFVNKWAPRINSYLEGSPTAGCGTDYAAAAWEYGVDPRWAPAISCIESSKGAACFRSYNAWGFGGMNFGSWSEGIYKVVQTLGGDLYGGALTKAAAQTYCPPTWSEWYNNVASEMAKI